MGSECESVVSASHIVDTRAVRVPWRLARTWESCADWWRCQLVMLSRGGGEEEVNAHVTSEY